MEKQEVVDPDKTDNQEVDYKKMYEAMTSKAERLEKESKKHKTRFDTVESLKTKLETLESEKLDRDGNLEDKVNHYKSKFDEATKETTELKSMILTNKVKDAFREVAPDCQKVDFVINNESYASEIRAAIDKENLSVDLDVLKTVYEKDKQSNPFLYGRKQIASSATGGSVADRRVSTNDSKVKDMGPNEYKEWALKQMNKK